MLKSFLTIFSLAMLLCVGCLNAKEPLRIEGSFNLKKRVKGEIIETTTWHPLQDFLDEHMGIPNRLRLSGKEVPQSTLELTFEVNKKSIFKKVINLENNQTPKGFSFMKLFYEKVIGKKGVLIFSIKDRKNNQIFSKKVDTRGDAG